MPSHLVEQLTENTVRVEIPPVEYFDFKEAVRFLQDSGAVTILDSIEEEPLTIHRSEWLDDRLYMTHLYSPDDSTLYLVVQAEDGQPPPTDSNIQQAVDNIRRRFFLDVDMEAVKEALSVDEYGRELVESFWPFRPANYGGAWEALLKSVVHAQIYPGLAKQLDIALQLTYGYQGRFDGREMFMLPRPKDLTRAIEEELRDKKFSRQKAGYLTTFPITILENPDRFDFKQLAQVDGDEAVERLKELHGVGKWISQNVAMRGLPHPDVFIEEKATRAALLPHYGHRGEITKQQFKQAADKFKPYRTFACYYTYMSYYSVAD